MELTKFRVLALGSCAALLIGAAPQLSKSPEPPPAQWSMIIVSKIKPEARMEYEGYQKELMGLYKKAGVKSRIVLETVFGDLAEYVSITPIAKFADLDDTGPMERVLGAEGAAKLRRRGSAYIQDLSRLASLANPDLSISTPTEQPDPYALVTFYRVAPGKAQDFSTFMKDEYLPMLKKGEVKNFWVSQTVFGAQGGERVAVRPLKKLGEIDDGPLPRRILGPEGAAKLAARQAGLYSSVQTRIMKYRTDLSYSAPPPQAKPAGQ